MKFRDHYFFLSNFYPAPFEYGSQKWATSEHFYMACKTDDPALKEKIRHLEKPGQVKRFSRTMVLRDDWEDIKKESMLLALRLKFNQNTKIRNKLINTKDRELVEDNYWHDNTWGNCNCDKCKGIVGENLLGKLLMQVRLEIKMIKVIIAGSRGITNFDLIEQEFVELFHYKGKEKDIQIISGTARGVDQLGERVGSKYGIEVIRMPANWDKLGKRAGYVRNAEMAKVGTHLLAFRLDNSKGTSHMIDLANKEGLEVTVFDYDSETDKDLII